MSFDGTPCLKVVTPAPVVIPADAVGGDGDSTDPNVSPTTVEAIGLN